MKTKEATAILFKMASEKQGLTSDEKDALWHVISILSDNQAAEDIRYGEF